MKYLTPSEFRAVEPRFTQGLDDDELKTYLEIAEAWGSTQLARYGITSPDSQCGSSFLTLYKRALYKYAASWIISDVYLGELDPKTLAALRAEAKEILEAAISACMGNTQTTVAPLWGYEEINWEDAK